MTFETSDLNVVLNGEVVLSRMSNGKLFSVMLSRTSNGKLFSINEEEQREALKGFYERLVSIIFLLVGMHDTYPTCLLDAITYRQ